MSAWLAVIGLLAHLVVAGACPVEARATGVATPFPICHAHGLDERGIDNAGNPSGHDGDPASGRHDHCAFCAAHCHATATLAPDVTMVRPVTVTAPDAVDPPSPRPYSVRLCVGASPRGPPPAI